MPASWRLLPGPARFVEPSGQRPVRLAPRLHLRAHRTRPRHHRDAPHALLQAQPPRPVPGGLTGRSTAAHPGEAARPTLRNGSGGLWAVAGMASAPTEAEREALTAHATPPPHLLAISTPLWAVPIGRPRRARAFPQVGLLLRGPLQGNRRRILRKPRGREGIALQGVEGDHPKHAGEMRGTQRLEALPQPVIMARDACEAGGGKVEWEGEKSARSRASTPRPHERPCAGGGGQKVSMSAAPLRWRTPPSTKGPWATGLLCCIATAMRHPFCKCSERVYPSGYHRHDIGLNPA